MSKRQILWLVLWLLLVIFSCWLFWDSCKDCNNCQERAVTEESTSDATNNATGLADPDVFSLNQPDKIPLYFNWEDPTAFTTDKFPEYKKWIVEQLGDKDNLEIYGFYSSDEPTPDGFDNMGFARAAKVRDLLSDVIDPSRMTLRAKKVDDDAEMRKNAFRGVIFRKAAAAVADNNADGSDTNTTENTGSTASVEQLDDREIVYFPFNDTKKEVDPRIDEYLDNLAKRIIASGEKVRLTGHTDNVGSAAYNMSLSDKRVRYVRRILRTKGVPREQIIFEAKGMTEPTATNSTDEGRAKNRRVEVQLLK